MKSEYINCKNCKDDCHCKGKDITPICISFKPAKTTNADSIRSMTDDELEKWYWWMHKEMMSATDSRTFVHDWLKQEVENNE